MFTLKNGDGMVWPDGKRIAVMVTFDFDAELLRKSVIGKRTIGFSDTSRGQYGPDEGLKRCLDMLERQQLKTTFFVPGRIAELYADKVQQIADAGHELAYHGYLHEASVDMPADEERENMAKSEALLEKISGRKVVGYRGPLDLLPNCAMQLMADAYKAKGDTGAWIKALEEGILKFPGNDYFFANLVDYYNSSNQASKAMEFADRMLANDPNNKLYLYVKAYLYHNMKEYDNAIEFYKKAIAADPEYAEAYSNVGLVYLMKAQDYADKATTDINDPKYAEAQAVVKKFYEEAKPFYEKARALKPDQKDLWLQGLYRVYYNLNMGPEFEEIDKMMK